MTDNETVAVPVEVLRRLADQYKGFVDSPVDVIDELTAFIPTPRPRLVALNLDDIKSNASSLSDFVSELRGYTDLLETLDGVVDDMLTFKEAADIKAVIRIALGVIE